MLYIVTPGAYVVLRLVECVTLGELEGQEGRLAGQSPALVA